MNARVTDHDLSDLVEHAAKGAVNSAASIHGGPLWEALEASSKNNVREAALPFIFHGTQALEEIGYRKPRVVTTVKELDALPIGSVVLHRGRPFQRFAPHNGGSYVYHLWQSPDGGFVRTSEGGRLILPATVIHEAQDQA
jgi:hypothetical protein